VVADRGPEEGLTLEVVRWIRASKRGAHIH
jgi:hypothetical protein